MIDGEVYCVNIPSKWTRYKPQRWVRNGSGGNPVGSCNATSGNEKGNVWSRASLEYVLKYKLTILTFRVYAGNKIQPYSQWKHTDTLIGHYMQWQVYWICRITTENCQHRSCQFHVGQRTAPISLMTISIMHGHLLMCIAWVEILSLLNGALYLLMSDDETGNVEPWKLTL